MMIDLSPLVQALIGTAAAVITLSAPVVAALIAKRLHLEDNSQAKDAINGAVQTGAGLAYSALVAESGKPASVEIKSAALALGLNHVISTVPDALKKVGVTDNAVAEMVAGRLGMFLSRDQSVTAGPSASAPPPSATTTPTVGSAS